VTTPRKLILIASVLAVVAAACASPSGSDSPGVSQSATTATSAPAEQGILPVGVSALDNRFDESFPPALVDPNDILSGGPPPDGIPPVDEPKFVSVDVADEWLNDPEPVLVVDVDGDVRGYPIQIMIWHEIVNDTVGGIPLAVTYCPLCNSAITFERTIRGVETTFGTSGSLYFANLVMYDRATESLWNQLDGRSVVGLLTGEVLKQFPSSTVSWAVFKESLPDAKVLDREQTGARRNYGTNPYTGLDDPNGQPFLFNGEIDVRAKAMQRIVAIESESSAVAWSLDALSGDVAAQATAAEFDGQPIAIFWQGGEASALDASDIAAGRDVGTVGVFNSTVDGETLTFKAVGDSFSDDQTSSTWNVLGEAIEGPMAGTKLEPVTFVRTFWFSWAAFRPDTTLVEAG
jgi:uncharacterized protein DUF3179